MCSLQRALDHLDAHALDLVVLLVISSPSAPGWDRQRRLVEPHGSRRPSNPRYQMFRRLGIPEIQDLYVASVARRQGVGVALVRFCEERARAQGATQMGIAVGLHAGFGAAQRLYARLGYVPDGAGVMYDRAAVHVGDMRIIDDDLTLMQVKDL